MYVHSHTCASFGTLLSRTQMFKCRSQSSLGCVNRGEFHTTANPSVIFIRVSPASPYWNLNLEKKLLVRAECLEDAQPRSKFFQQVGPTNGRRRFNSNFRIPPSDWSRVFGGRGFSSPAQILARDDRCQMSPEEELALLQRSSFTAYLILTFWVFLYDALRMRHLGSSCPGKKSFSYRRVSLKARPLSPEAQKDFEKNVFAYPERGSRRFVAGSRGGRTPPLLLRRILVFWPLSPRPAQGLSSHIQPLPTVCSSRRPASGSFSS